MAGRTTIIIAHRLSTIALADEIVVLEDGVVAARGQSRATRRRESGVRRDLAPRPGRAHIRVARRGRTRGGALVSARMRPPPRVLAPGGHAVLLGPDVPPPGAPVQAGATVQGQGDRVGPGAARRHRRRHCWRRWPPSSPSTAASALATAKRSCSGRSRSWQRRCSAGARRSRRPSSRPGSGSACSPTCGATSSRTSSRSSSATSSATAPAG